MYVILYTSNELLAKTIIPESPIESKQLKKIIQTKAFNFNLLQTPLETPSLHLATAWSLSNLIYYPLAVMYVHISYVRTYVCNT